MVTDEQLIARVRRNPIIWDHSCPGFRNNALRQQCWQKMTAETHSRQHYLKDRWRALRKKYYRETQKVPLQRRMTVDGEVGVSEVWPLMQRMHFLDGATGRSSSVVSTKSNCQPNSQQTSRSSSGSRSPSPLTAVATRADAAKRLATMRRRSSMATLMADGPDAGEHNYSRRLSTREAQKPSSSTGNTSQSGVWTQRTIDLFATKIQHGILKNNNNATRPSSIQLNEAIKPEDSDINEADEADEPNGAGNNDGYDVERTTLTVRSLIERVARRPVLWRNSSCSSWSERRPTEKRQLCWQDLSQHFLQSNGDTVTAEHIQAIWKTIVEQHSNALLNPQESPSSNNDDVWDLMPSLAFLTDELKHRTCTPTTEPPIHDHHPNAAEQPADDDEPLVSQSVAHVPSKRRHSALSDGSDKPLAPTEPDKRPRIGLIRRMSVRTETSISSTAAGQARPQPQQQQQLTAPTVAVVAAVNAPTAPPPPQPPAQHRTPSLHFQNFTNYMAVEMEQMPRRRARALTIKMLALLHEHLQY